MADGNIYNFVNLQPKGSPWNPGETVTVGAYFDLSTTASSAGLAVNDLIIASSLIPAGGVTIQQVLVCGQEMDTDTTTVAGTFSVGDCLISGATVSANFNPRFISGTVNATAADGPLVPFVASMGSNLNTLKTSPIRNIAVYQNVTPTISSTVFTGGAAIGTNVAGVGYTYATTENFNVTNTNMAATQTVVQGNVAIILQATVAPTTPATSGIVYLYVTYVCNGSV